MNSLAPMMPSAFSVEISMKSQKKINTRLNRVKISRFARQLHATAKKLFTKKPNAGLTKSVEF
jgi:hypothetical protein